MQNPEKQKRKEAQVEKNNTGNAMLILVLGFIAVILAIGGLYFYMSKSQSVANAPQTAAIQQQAATIDNLESDLSSIDVSDTNSDLDALDKDLQSL